MDGRTTTMGGLIYGTYMRRRWYFRFDRVPLQEVRRRVGLQTEILDGAYNQEARLIYVTLKKALCTWMYDQLGDDTRRPFYLTEPEWNFRKVWVRLPAEDRDAIWDYAVKVNPELPSV